MLHQTKKIRQLGDFDPPFVQRQDEVALCRAECEIAVLDALGNAFAGNGRADVVLGEEAGQRIVRDLRIDRHRHAFSQAASSSD